VKILEPANVMVWVRKEEDPTMETGKDREERGSAPFLLSWKIQ
jgi:hypothetical protein